MFDRIDVCDLCPDSQTVWPLFKQLVREINQLEMNFKEVLNKQNLCNPSHILSSKKAINKFIQKIEESQIQLKEEGTQTNLRLKKSFEEKNPFITLALNCNSQVRTLLKYFETEIAVAKKVDEILDFFTNLNSKFEVMDNALVFENISDQNAYNLLIQSLCEVVKREQALIRGIGIKRI